MSVCKKSYVVISSHRIINEINVPTCDHYPVMFNLLGVSLEVINETKTICFRNIKNIDQHAFSQDLNKVVSYISYESVSFEQMINLFNFKCTKLLDEYAPIVKKTDKRP